MNNKHLTYEDAEKLFDTKIDGADILKTTDGLTYRLAVLQYVHGLRNNGYKIDY